MLFKETRLRHFKFHPIIDDKELRVNSKQIVFNFLVCLKIVELPKLFPPIFLKQFLERNLDTLNF